MKLLKGAIYYNLLYFCFIRG